MTSHQSIREASPMSEFKRVADAKDVPPGNSACVELAGEKVALFNVSGTLHAISDTCTHRGGTLSEGDVDGTVVTCPLHGATFELTTGKVIGPPAVLDVKRYQVRVEGDEIHIAAP